MRLHFHNSVQFRSETPGCSGGRNAPGQVESSCTCSRVWSASRRSPLQSALYVMRRAGLYVSFSSAACKSREKMRWTQWRQHACRGSVQMITHPVADSQTGHTTGRKGSTPSRKEAEWFPVSRIWVRRPADPGKTKSGQGNIRYPKRRISSEPSNNQACHFSHCQIYDYRSVVRWNKGSCPTCRDSSR